ncbi:MAG: hypothetical protein IMY88_03200 [Chloroflexi bacterium]|nr:hypothetical protein [Chloroflexota bacterium]
MVIDLGLLIGLVAIALAILLGLWGFRKGITNELSTIKEAAIAIRATVDKTWDLVALRFGESGGTVVRNLENLGKLKLQPSQNQRKPSTLLKLRSHY